MAPKKKGGGPGVGGGGEGKKGVRTSKLAKMNEQERTRYLERKMAEEEETKRRKEEMVNVFMKIKLSKEERNAGLNNSKLIDRWRAIRRQVKTQELLKDVVVLQEAFQRALFQKNRHIEMLLQELDESEEQYNMCFRSQMDSMATMTKAHEARVRELVGLHEAERLGILRVSEAEKAWQMSREAKMEVYMDDVIIALDQKHGIADKEIRNECQIVKENMKNKHLEERQAAQLHMEEIMDNLWLKMQDQVASFRTATEEKQRVYNELLSKDQKGVSEVAENNRKIQRLMEDVAKLKETLVELGDVEEKRLSGVRAEKEELTKELSMVRKAVSVVARNREERSSRKLVLAIDSVEKAIRETCKHFDQMTKLSQQCQALELKWTTMPRPQSSTTMTFWNRVGMHRPSPLMISGRHGLKLSGQSVQELDPILNAISTVQLDVSALNELKQELESENTELVSGMGDLFKTLSTSREVAAQGLVELGRVPHNHIHVASARASNF